MKIKAKLLVTNIVMTILIIAVISLVFIFSSMNWNRDMNMQFAEELLQRHKSNLQAYVDIVYSLMEETYEQGVASGNLEEAKLRIMENSRVMLYDQGAGYFWINDTTLPYPIMIAHAITPELEGKVLDDPKYNCAMGEGKNLFAAMVEVTAATGSGFVDYEWAKPGETTLSPKLSYVRLFRPLGWIIGTGIYIDDIDRVIAEREAQNAAELRRNILTILVAAGVLLLLSGVIFFLFAAGISRPLVKVTKLADQIARGDLDVDRVESKARDETAMLIRSFMTMVEVLQEKSLEIDRIADGDLTVEVQKVSEHDSLGKALSLMKESLNEILGQVRESVDRITGNSDQISLSSQSLSQGATEQASSLEEISSSLAEINSQSGQNAKNASEASGQAKTASETAAAGNTQIKELTASMAEIDNSSDEISKIVKVIDDIAFQINLLALNANVEAARAGKYGKGFAVVAEEVRNLANKSADAVKETTVMVERSINGIKNGNKAVEKTAEYFAEIVTSIEKVAQFLEEIDHASREQAMGIEQITTALDQISLVTQTNTSGAEETASAAEELAAEALELKSMVERFKLETMNETYRLPSPE
ncbi:MAG: cache domain-containing protein [Spirochaetales bacterium]|nr:cache domain-containing protein [Spirochaetales bacterium]